MSKLGFKYFQFFKTNLHGVDLEPDLSKDLSDLPHFINYCKLRATVLKSCSISHPLITAAFFVELIQEIICPDRVKIIYKIKNDRYLVVANFQAATYLLIKNIRRNGWPQ